MNGYSEPATAMDIANLAKYNSEAEEIISQPNIRYLGVMMMKQQVEHACSKASAVRASLARLLPNIEDTKQSKRHLTLIISALPYRISGLTDVRQKQKSPSKYSKSS